MAGSKKIKGAGKNKHKWTIEEDEKLIDVLMELHASGKYAGADSGFKHGYLKAAEKLLHEVLPDSKSVLFADPHIKSRMKTWKAHFSIVYDMVVGAHTSGFGWDPVKCCVTADDAVWDEYCETHKGAINFKGKPFLYYEKLCTIFGKDRATGSRAVDLGDLGDENEVEEMQRSSPIDVDEFDVDPNMNANMSEAPTASVSSKCKRGKNVEFDTAYRETCTEIKDTLAAFGRDLNESISNMGAKETKMASDIMKRVIEEMKVLSGINAKDRLKAIHVIGNNQLTAEMFFEMDQSDKICMIEMVKDGSIV